MWTAVAVVAVCLGLVHGVQLYAVPSNPRPLAQHLSELPYDFGGWVGADAVLEDHVFEFLGAEQAINRSYTGPDGQSVSVHVAAWIGPEEWAPHPPEGCYTSAGWGVVGGEKRALAGSPVRAQTFTAQRQGEELRVMYWYRLGDVYFKNRDEARRARRALWGEREWPPLIKVLMQSPETGFNDPGPGMETLARAIDEWTRTL
jgi:EpsI family protein